MVNTSARDGNHDDLWVGIQIFVSGSANIAKALWGQGQRLAAQRAQLRASLNVDDTSPLRDVAMRNHFEHYDERIDRWNNESKQHNVLDRMIGPPSAVAGIDTIDRFRVYEPGTMMVHFWGDSFQLQPIADEVSRLFPIAQYEAEKPRWEL